MMAFSREVIPQNYIRIYFLLFVVLLGTNGFAQDNSIPGEVSTPYPTVLNLAVEWNIRGDDNQNGIVKVLYREKGEKIWKKGMALRRVPAGENIGFFWKNKHSGSVFDLRPGTKYEIKLRLEDPDGGSAERTVEAVTRQIPHYDSSAEIIELKAGSYDTLHTKDGSAVKPLVYRCSGGQATFTHINLKNRNHVFIEGLTVNNPHKNGIGIQFNGARNCVIRHCTVNAVYGIVAYKPGAENCYISDNVVTGVNNWTNAAMGAHGDNIGEGIELTGPGNVICYNRVTGFRDCISTMEDSHVVNQTCIDIYNNDIYTAPDDAIEADFCFSNCRIFQNRITNCFVGLSSQPGLGGPNYFYRNVMYNVVHAAFKLKRYSQGDVVIHNTVIKVGTGLGGNDTMDYAFFRNNLAIGGPTGGVNWGDYGAGNPYASDIIDPGKHSNFDYDAVGTYEVPYIANIGDIPFSKVEKHGIEGITLESTFKNIKFPNPPVPERAAPDLRPQPGSRVIDAGVQIPNMNDNFLGKAPDCGAYEAGLDLPHYGPRKKLVFEDDFRLGLDHWVVEKFDRDVVNVEPGGDQMKVNTRNGVDGVMIWCKNLLPENFMVEYDVTPVSESGFFLLFFCVQNSDQSDFLTNIENKFTTRTLFEKYTAGEIQGYHISYRRNDSQTCNLRKNPGYKAGNLLKQQTIPGILSAGKVHHVVLTKTGPHIILEVDGIEFMNFTDDGSVGGVPYAGGRLGFRQVYDSEGYYDNFRIWDLGE